MPAILIYALLIVIAVFGLWVIVTSGKKAVATLNAKKRARVEENKNRILKELNVRLLRSARNDEKGTRNDKGGDNDARARGITNDEVQALLKVSHATATRYMDQLEKEGKVVQYGVTSDSYYELK